MSPSISVNEVQVESYVFLPTVPPPALSKSFFLGGTGLRGLEIDGNFIKFTAVAVYREESDVYSFSSKWKGKIAALLADSVEFINERDDTKSCCRRDTSDSSH